MPGIDAVFSLKCEGCGRTLRQRAVLPDTKAFGDALAAGVDLFCPFCKKPGKARCGAITTPAKDLPQDARDAG